MLVIYIIRHILEFNLKCSTKVKVLNLFGNFRRFIFFYKIISILMHKPLNKNILKFVKPLGIQIYDSGQSRKS